MHLNDIGTWMKKNKSYEYNVDENGFLCFEDSATPEPASYAGQLFGKKGYISFPVEPYILQKPPQIRYEIVGRMKDEFLKHSKGYQGSIQMLVLCDAFRIGKPRKKKLKSLYDNNERFFDEDNHQIIIYPVDSRKLRRGIVPGFLPT